MLLQRRNRISVTDFSFNFNGFSDSDCLYYFRFTKSDVLRVVNAINWPNHTQRKIDTTQILSCRPVFCYVDYLDRVDGGTWNFFSASIGLSSPSFSGKH